MRLNVFFTPSAIIPAETVADDIYIVVDVIRATTTLAVMFDQGAARVLVAETIEQAREAAQRLPGTLLCGERNVKPLPGFDYGNSPVQFSQVDLTGRELVLTTTNGTRAFYACPDESIRLAGCFYNAKAVAAKAWELAQEHDRNINIVCAAEYGHFALDDVVCAGYLASQIQLQEDVEPEKPPLVIDESAEAALTLYHSYPGSEITWLSQSAQSVIEAGLPEDVDFCLQKNMSVSVPMVVGTEEETGLLIIEKS